MLMPVCTSSGAFDMGRQSRYGSQERGGSIGLATCYPAASKTLHRQTTEVHTALSRLKSWIQGGFSIKYYDTSGFVLRKGGLVKFRRKGPC